MSDLHVQGVVDVQNVILSSFVNHIWLFVAPHLVTSAWGIFFSKFDETIANFNIDKLKLILVRGSILQETVVVFAILLVEILVLEPDLRVGGPDLINDGRLQSRELPLSGAAGRVPRAGAGHGAAAAVVPRLVARAADRGAAEAGRAVHHADPALVHTRRGRLVGAASVANLDNIFTG